MGSRQGWGVLVRANTAHASTIQGICRANVRTCVRPADRPHGPPMVSGSASEGGVAGGKSEGTANSERRVAAIKVEPEGAKQPSYFALNTGGRACTYFATCAVVVSYCLRRCSTWSWPQLGSSGLAGW